VGIWTLPRKSTVITRPADPVAAVEFGEAAAIADEFEAHFGGVVSVLSREPS
jgi:hypothetical protein